VHTALVLLPNTHFSRWSPLWSWYAWKAWSWEKSLDHWRILQRGEKEPLWIASLLMFSCCFFGWDGDGGMMLLSLQINITRERVSLDYPELDQAINDDNFTKAFYTYYCLSECSSENCRMVWVKKLLSWVTLQNGSHSCMSLKLQ